MPRGPRSRRYHLISLRFEWFANCRHNVIADVGYRAFAIIREFIAH
jgi:hypothetical protein